VNTVEIDAETHASLIEPFVSAACATLQDMAGVEVFPQEIYRANVCKTVADVTAVIELEFSSTGMLVLGFSREAAAAVAARILAETGTEPDEELIRDCVGEIANIISGQAKALLHGTRFAFAHSTPRFLIGAGQLVSPEPGCFGVVFASDLGQFSLQICANL
jgi:chemotaxis protein CheX